MRKFHLAIFWVAFFCIFVHQSNTAQARPAIPKNEIPANIERDVREKIEKLYAVSAIERAKAAAPFLAGLLDEETPLQHLAQGEITTPAREAAKALASIGSEAREELFKALKSKNATTRKNAAYGLGRLGDPESIRALIKVIDDGNSEVRNSAIVALGKIRDPRAARGQGAG